MKPRALLLYLVCVPQALWAQAPSPALPLEQAPVSLATTRAPTLGWAENLVLSAAAGQLGEEALYSFHLAYFPTQRLGLEATIAHNPSGSTHAALHHVGAVVPLLHAGRLRPFVVAGLGTIQVFPGTATNAKSVTKLMLHAGGGAQLHLRGDVALRVEARGLSAVDQQEDHSGFLGYAQWSVGLAFHRRLRASSALDRGEGS